MRAGGLLRAAALAACAAAVGHAALRTPEGLEVDERLFRAVNAEHGPGADRFFRGITELGSLYACGAAAGSLMVLGERRAALDAAAAAAASWVLGQAVKKIVSRPRPYHADSQDARRMIAAPRGTSWPSSHPAVLTTFTRVAARELDLGTASRAALSCLDLAVATSRVYLGRALPVRRRERPVDGPGGRARVAPGAPVDSMPMRFTASVGWPVLDRFRLGSRFAISPHGIFIAIGFMIGVWLLGKIGPERGIPAEEVNAIGFWSLIGAIIGARFFYVLAHYSEFTSFKSMLEIYNGGISLLGGIAGAP